MRRSADCMLSTVAAAGKYRTSQRPSLFGMGVQSHQAFVVPSTHSFQLCAMRRSSLGLRTSALSTPSHRSAVYIPMSSFAQQCQVQALASTMSPCPIAGACCGSLGVGGRDDMHISNIRCVVSIYIFIFPLSLLQALRLRIYRMWYDYDLYRIPAAHFTFLCWALCRCLPPFLSTLHR
jgi:hypothetical protein